MTKTFIQKEISNKEEEIFLKIKVNNKNINLSCLEKQYFNKKNNQVVGYISKKKQSFSGKQYGTLNTITGYNIDVREKKRLFQRTVAYIKIDDEKYIGVTKNFFLFFLFILLIALLGCCVSIKIFMNSPAKPTPVSPPSFNPNENTSTDSNNQITATITLPQGETKFDGSINSDTAKSDNTDLSIFDGKAKITVNLYVEDSTHLLLQEFVKIEKGILPDIILDFTKLDFELKPGIYTGTILIEYSDGTSIEKPLDVIIRENSSGSIGVTYSDKVTVDLTTSQIDLKYCVSDATEDTIVQLVLISNGKEYLLAQSNRIKYKEDLTSLTLLENMKTMLQPGTYYGVLRISFDQSSSTNRVAGLSTDIEVEINVK